MRGKLPTKEPNMQKRWKEGKLYEKMLENRREPSLSFCDGLHASDIHIGHALNKIIRTSSYVLTIWKLYTPIHSGMGYHGLPIETAIPKLGHDRRRCR
ncbi:MAG: class I tRNA ligase family protein [Merdibacter sp.]